MTSIGPIKRRILSTLRDGKPRWARSFQDCKRNLDALVEAGMVERVKPPTGKSRNMVAITGAGLDALNAGGGQ